MITLALVIGFSLGVTLCLSIKQNVLKDDVPTEPIARDKIDKLIYFIENEYLEDVDTDLIVEQAVNEILARLDPHSVYIGKHESESIKESMRGNFVGIGINFYMYNDTLTVIQTIKNGPSEQVGIKAGDRILIVDSDTIYGKNYSSAAIISKLKGKKNSKLKATIFRKTENKKYDFVITRNTVPLKSIDISVKLNDHIGYIKINRFAETTAKEFRKALKTLLKQNINALVIDLRDNTGGYVDAATTIADEFLAQGELILITKDKKGMEEKTFATEKGLFENGKLYVLINENSASSSEILAGAIQDNDRGTIIGKMSYGKGLVQREMPLGDGSTVRLTVAQYCTPTGRSIQKPYKNISKEEYYHPWEKQTEYHPNDSLKFTTKSGKIVYGGGGIYPDIVSEDAAENSSVVFMMNSVLSSNFVFEIIDKNRYIFTKLDEKQIYDYLLKNQFYYNEFKEYFTQKEIYLSFDKNQTIIKKYLKAEFIRQLFSEGAYYKIMIEDDPMIRTAIIDYEYTE